MMHPTFTRRLPLAGAPNTRDLGGYPCPGGVTRWGQFLRSATTFTMQPKDIETLLAYGVSNAIDLRSEQERVVHPSMLESAEGFTCHHISMLDQMNSSHFEGDLPGSMAGLYISLLDNNAAGFAAIFSVFAGATGGMLFHCTAGKDRTGVTAMLLLKLAGVEDADVIADYAVTDIYMREAVVHQIGSLRRNPNAPPMPDYVFRSLPESMERALQHLAKTYGTAENYLLQAGVTAKEIAAVKAKLVQ
ncbi:tyrosine-protein phosphatase [Ruminococcaceae bacterium OttesenSCG-928-A16]|nr:tyrosine-protein phosphatase [Ruminococcaceae bacterium OttesenSCG-928-A16]